MSETRWTLKIKNSLLFSFPCMSNNLFWIEYILVASSEVVPASEEVVRRANDSVGVVEYSMLVLGYNGLRKD